MNITKSKIGDGLVDIDFGAMKVVIKDCPGLVVSELFNPNVVHCVYHGEFFFYEGGDLTLSQLGPGEVAAIDITPGAINAANPDDFKSPDPKKVAAWNLVKTMLSRVSLPLVSENISHEKLTAAMELLRP